MTTAGAIVAVCRSAKHTMSKPSVLTIRLVVGIGVEGDAHAGTTVQHSYTRRKDPTAPNLRQVHLLQSELLDELRAISVVEPGAMGENVTTRGVDLLALPRGTRLRLGREAVVELTGLRGPCVKLDRLRKGLMAACLDRSGGGRPSPRAGVMAIVVASGDVAPGDPVAVELPAGPHAPLEPV